MTDLALIQMAPPARLAALLGHGVSGALVERFNRSPRLQARLAALVTSRLDQAGPLDAAQAKALAMTARELSQLARQAGATWHAQAIARVIGGAAQRRVIDALGLDAYRGALANAHLAPPDRAEPADLVVAIETDGAASLAAWCALQPPAVAARVALIRPDAQPLAAHAVHGPAIIAGLLEG